MLDAGVPGAVRHRASAALEDCACGHARAGAGTDRGTCRDRRCEQPRRRPNQCWRGPIATAAWSGRRQRSTTRRLVSCSLLAAVVAGGLQLGADHNAAQGWRRSGADRRPRSARALPEGASRPYDAYDKGHEIMTMVGTSRSGSGRTSAAAVRFGDAGRVVRDRGRADENARRHAQCGDDRRRHVRAVR